MSNSPADAEVARLIVLICNPKSSHFGDYAGCDINETNVAFRLCAVVLRSVPDMRARQEQETFKIDRTGSLLKTVGRSGMRKRKSPPDRERHDRKSPIGISLFFSVASLALIMAAVLLFFRSGGGSRSSNGDMGFAPVLMETLESEIPDGISKPLSGEDAIGLVRSALNSRDPAVVGHFLIFGDSAQSPQKAIELLDHIETKDGRPHGFEYLGPKVASGGDVEEVMVTFDSA